MMFVLLLDWCWAVAFGYCSALLTAFDCLLLLLVCGFYGWLLIVLFALTFWLYML